MSTTTTNTSTHAIESWIVENPTFLDGYIKMLVVLGFIEAQGDLNQAESYFDFSTKTKHPIAVELLKVKEFIKHPKKAKPFHHPKYTPNWPLQIMTYRVNQAAKRYLGQFEKLTKREQLLVPKENFEILLKVYKHAFHATLSKRMSSLENNLFNFAASIIEREIGFKKFCAVGFEEPAKLWRENKHLWSENEPGTFVQWCIKSLEDLEQAIFNGVQVKEDEEIQINDKFYFVSALNTKTINSLNNYLEIASVFLDKSIPYQHLVIAVEFEQLEKFKKEEIYGGDKNLFAILQINNSKEIDFPKDDIFLLFMNFDLTKFVNPIKLLQFQMPNPSTAKQRWIECSKEKNYFSIDFNGRMKPNEFFIANSTINAANGYIPSRYFDSEIKYQSLSRYIEEIFPIEPNNCDKSVQILKNFPDNQYLLFENPYENQHIENDTLNKKSKYYNVSEPVLIQVNSLNKFYVLRPKKNNLIYINENFVPENFFSYFKSGDALSKKRVLEIKKHNFFKIRVFRLRNFNVSLEYLCFHLNDRMRHNYITSVTEVGNWTERFDDAWLIMFKLRRNAFVPVKEKYFLDLKQKAINRKNGGHEVRIFPIYPHYHLSFSEKIIHFNDFLSKIDVTKIKFKIPNISIQQETLNILMPLNEEAKEMNKKVDDNKKRFYQEKTESEGKFRSLIHSLGRPHANAQSWARLMSKFFSDLNDPELESRFKQNYGKTITQAAENIRLEILRASKMLEIGEHALKIEKYPLENIYLETLKEIIEQKDLPDNKFQIQVSILKSRYKSKDTFIQCNRDLWSLLFDLIFDNANKHAFDSKADHQKIIVTFEVNRNYTMVEIKNNGKSFPENFDRQAFITKFKTTEDVGHGIGGSDIHEIIKHFGDPDWELQLDGNAEFPVVFRFKLNCYKYI
jgi:hypothetical protein